MVELWSMVQHMVDVPLTTGGSLATVRTSQPMQRAFVSQALKYLEKRYPDKKQFCTCTEAHMKIPDLAHAC